MRHTNIHSSNLSSTKRRSNTVAIESMEGRRLLTSVVVNTTIDAVFPAGSPFVSLRNAIATASANPSTTVTFDSTVFASHQTIKLNGNQLELSGSGVTSLTAPASGLTISGANLTRVLQVDGGTTATLSGLTITDGYSTGAGGGLLNYGSLTLKNITINDNETTQYGGGISDQGGKLTMSDCVVSGNTAPNGTGGIDNNNASTVTLTGVTISDNTGGPALEIYGSTGDVYDSTISDNNLTLGSSNGISVDNGSTVILSEDTLTGNTSTSGTGGVANVSGTLTIEDVTIVGNSGGSGVGGLYNGSNPPTVSNSIIAGNSGSLGPDVDGSFNSLGFNLIGKSDGSSGFNSADLTGTIAHPLNAKLGSLANNGGPTETLLPLAGSPAIGAGLVAYVPKGVTTDQRGLARVVNGKVDIGAVELQGSVVTTTITATAPAAQTATVGTAKSFSLGSFTETNATAPYTATVVWGDGTANTTIKLTAAGTIPATTHTYAKAGTDTVSVTVTDAKGNKSNTAPFKVTVTAAATGTISGIVFNDSNGDKKQDDGELGLGDCTVFIDLKDTGKYAAGDPTAVTPFDGVFSFTGLAAGTYRILVEPESGTVATTPTVLTITLKAGGVSSGNLFGLKAIA